MPRVEARLPTRGGELPFPADRPRGMRFEHDAQLRKPAAARAPTATVAILLQTIFTGLAKWARGAHFL